MSVCPKISVIIPVFNGEKYLRKCLDSVILQTYKNLEIIIVNDGSTDGTAQILSEYKAKDDRIRVFEQEHSGTANARNYGMTAASGEYISFVDADDWILLSLYEIFVKLNPPQGVDIYNFNAESYVENSKEIFSKKMLNIDVWKNHATEDTIHTFYNCIDPFTGNLTVCNKIYNAHFLRKNNIRFLENKIFEHQLFHMQTFLKSSSILVSSETYYRYRVTNENSVTNSLGKNVFDIFDIFEKVCDEVRAAGMEDAYKYALFQYKYTQLNTLFHKIRFSLKQEFFETMKTYLGAIDLSGFDMEICKKLTDFYQYEDIINNDWIHYSLGRINSANPLAQVKTFDFAAQNAQSADEFPAGA